MALEREFAAQALRALPHSQNSEMSIHDRKRAGGLKSLAVVPYA
jgi:hypothetical protein